MGGGSKTPSETKNIQTPYWATTAAGKQLMADAEALYQQMGGGAAQAVQQEMPTLTPEMTQALTSLGASADKLNEIGSMLNAHTGKAGEYLNTAGQLATDYANGKMAINGDQINDLTKQLYDNELVNSQTSMLREDVTESYNSALQALNQRSNASGSMGSSRAGVAQGVMYGKAETAYARGSADIMNSARTTAQQTALGALTSNQAAQLSGINTLGTLGTNLASQYSANLLNQANLMQTGLQNQYAAGAIAQTMQEQQQLVKYQNALAQYNAGWNNMLNYQAVMGGAGGTSTTTSTGGSGGMTTAQGALGGAMSGASMGASFGPWGAAIGGVIGAVGGGLSARG